MKLMKLHERTVIWEGANTICGSFLLHHDGFFHVGGPRDCTCSAKHPERIEVPTYTEDPWEAEVEKRDDAQLVNCCDGGGCSDVCFCDPANLPCPSELPAIDRDSYFDQRCIDVLQELVSRFGDTFSFIPAGIHLVIREFPTYSRQALADEYLARCPTYDYYERMLRESRGKT
jgi:hypothetical protein